MLRQPVMYCKESWFNKMIEMWNSKRNEVGFYPPHGWPLSTSIFIIAFLTVMIILSTGYIRIIQKKFSHCGSNKTNKMRPHEAFQSIQKNSVKIKSQLFDTDSSTIIVDNSANCIIWNDKSGFDPESYISLANDFKSGITSATGEGVPVGIGTLVIGWYDDNYKFHNFSLPNAYHVPQSPVNILGLSYFSKIMGDYQIGGTRINYSGKDSVFTWDHSKYNRTFMH